MIRRISDGLFSKGGVTPTFSKIGKAWASKGAFHLHLVQLQGDYERAKKYNSPEYGWRKRSAAEIETHNPAVVYAGCEVVEFKYVEAAKKDIVRYMEERLNNKKGTDVNSAEPA